MHTPTGNTPCRVLGPVLMWLVTLNLPCELIDNRARRTTILCTTVEPCFWHSSQTFYRNQRCCQWVEVEWKVYFNTVSVPLHFVVLVVGCRLVDRCENVIKGLNNLWSLWIYCTVVRSWYSLIWVEIENLWNICVGGRWAVIVVLYRFHGPVWKMMLN